MTEPLLFERAGPLVTLTFNAPERRNPLGEEEDCAAIVAAAEKINADDAVKVAIVTGAGSAFSGGGDLRAIRDRITSGQVSPLAIRERYRTTIHRMVRALWSLDVPLIAAVNGPAIGLGNDVACVADVRIASTKAVFGATFLRVGLVPGDGGAWILPRVIGIQRAAELLFTAKTIDAETALSWGLVSRVVAPEALMNEARALAGEIAAQPAGVLRMTKRLLRESLGASFDAIMETSAAMQALAHQTPEHLAYLQSFLGKSPR